MTMAGRMREAELSTFRLKMTSSHVASVLPVIFCTTGTTNFLQSHPVSHANRKAATTRMA